MPRPRSRFLVWVCFNQWQPVNRLLLIRSIFSLDARLLLSWSGFRDHLPFTFLFVSPLFFSLSIYVTLFIVPTLFFTTSNHFLMYVLPFSLSLGWPESLARKQLTTKTINQNPYLYHTRLSSDYWLLLGNLTICAWYYSLTVIYRSLQVIKTDWE